MIAPQKRATKNTKMRRRDCIPFLDHSSGAGSTIFPINKLRLKLTRIAGRFSLACARSCAHLTVSCFTSDWFQVLSSGIPIASFLIMRITMTLTRRNGQLVPLGQNEALKILLARSDHEGRRDFYSHSEQSFFGRLLRIFVAVAQTAFPLHR